MRLAKIYDIIGRYLDLQYSWVWLRKYFVFIIVFALTNLALAQEVKWDVDLSKYFLTENMNLNDPNFELQSGGSCHVFAALNLFEAMCYKKTCEQGKCVRLNLSRAQFFLRHLKKQVAVAYNWDQLYKSGYTTGGPFDLIFPFDAGDPADTLAEVLGNGGCSNSELNFDTKFVGDLTRLRDKILETNFTNISELKSNLLSNLDKISKESMKVSTTTDATRYVSVSIPPVCKALKLVPNRKNVSPSKIAEIVKKGTPVICSGETQNAQGITEGASHSYVITAVGTHQGQIAGNIRDSTKTYFEPSFIGECPFLTWLE